ncbi:hypothetical protein [Mycobacterium sp. AT1]|uniref:hypothetical protein n=1 Tax=Mycobacterium sp. AT1 TaxID=1961706 RepID=UPI001301E288|nr:hypothetical protein [Mycobacterium sp. AT1]
MRHYYTGVLMRQATFGRGICAVIGSGENGRDALWVATFRRRNGVRASAIVLN